MGCGASVSAPPPDTDGTPSASVPLQQPASKPAAEPNDVATAATTRLDCGNDRALRAIFNTMDTDGSGSVSQAELRAKLSRDNEIQTLLTRAGGDGSEYVWQQLDHDGDGTITWAEFEAFLSSDTGAFVKVVAGVDPEKDVGPPNSGADGGPRASFGPPNPSTPSLSAAELLALFDSIDVDGNGWITQPELRQHLSTSDAVKRQLARIGGDADARIFEQLDEDGDGNITRAEFSAMLSEDGGAFAELMAAETEAGLIEAELANAGL